MYAIRSYYEETLVEIHLTSLSSTSVYELVKDTYFCNDEDCRRLTDLVLLKTNGNPYYVIEFLSSLYANKQAVFNNNSGLWILDFKSIIKAKVTENVVELISDRFMLLSPDLQDVLHYASCMGIVITSYSIHYTKLYDFTIRPGDLFPDWNRK